MQQAKVKAVRRKNFKDEAEVKWERDESFLPRANIIGTTTTGAGISVSLAELGKPDV